MRIPDAGGMYSFQLNILELLIDIQAAIAEHKSSTPSKNRPKRSRRSDLSRHRPTRREMRWPGWSSVSTVATLGALRQNKKAPPPQRDAALEGGEGHCRIPREQGARIPTVSRHHHLPADGDAAFVDVSQSPRYLWTCEIKTSRRTPETDDPEGVVRAGHPSDIGDPATAERQTWQRNGRC